MAVITNYGSLKTEVKRYINRGTDVDNDIPLWIQLGLLRIYRDVRVRAFEQSLSATISSGVVALPTGYLDLKFAYIEGSPTTALERKDSEWIHFHYPTRSAEGRPLYIGREASSFIFGPYPDAAYTVKGIVYAKLTAFANDSDANWLTTDGADLMLYAALMEAHIFLRDNDEAVKWEARYQATKRAIQVYEEQEEFSGSPLAVTVR